MSLHIVVILDDSCGIDLAALVMRSRDRQHRDRGRVDREAKKVSIVLIDSYDALLPQLAKEARRLFTPLAAVPERHTFDGIHLNAAGCEVWDRAILQGESRLHFANLPEITLICVVTPPE